MGASFATNKIKWTLKLHSDIVQTETCVGLLACLLSWAWTLPTEILFKRQGDKRNWITVVECQQQSLGTTYDGQVARTSNWPSACVLLLSISRQSLKVILPGREAYHLETSMNNILLFQSIDVNTFSAPYCLPSYSKKQSWKAAATGINSSQFEMKMNPPFCRGGKFTLLRPFFSIIIQFFHVYLYTWC